MNCLGVSLMNRVGLKDGRTKGISESGLGSSNIKRASVEAEQRDTQTGSAPLDVGRRMHLHLDCRSRDQKLEI